MLLSVLVPFYNEKNTLELCVHDISKYLDSRPFESELILIDDGSTDGSADIARQLCAIYARVKVVRHERNLGKGAAIKSGIEQARGLYIGYLDTDLSTKPDTFDQALAKLDVRTLVFASRSHGDSFITKQQPLFRVIAGKLFNFCIRWMLDLPYRDTQCGFKAFHKDVKPVALSVMSDGWAFDAELLYRAKQAGLSLGELPVVWQHHDESRVKLSDAPRIYGELKRIKKQRTLPPSRT